MASSLSTPNFIRPNSIAITPSSFEAIGAAGRTLVTAGYASAIWPTTNLIILFPFTISTPYTVGSLFVCNGAVVSGNFDIGIYDNGGNTSTVNRIISTGSTAQAGTSVPQSVVAATTLLPGQYYAALVFDGIVATVLARAPAAAGQLAAKGFAQVAAGTVVLPSTLTLALMATAYIPLFGLSMKASV